MSDPSPTESSSKQTNPKLKNRLTFEGSQILHDYWNKHPGEMPSVQVRKALTEAIKKIPGCEFYKLANTNGWFRTRLDKIKKVNEVPTDPRFPSLTPAVLEHLNVLLRDQPNPSPDVINTWAKLIAGTGAAYQDVVTWAHLSMQSQIHSHQTDPLPTPANTVSPEPANLKPVYAPGSLSPTQMNFESSSPAQVQPTQFKQSPTQSPMLPPPLSIRTSQSRASPIQFRPYPQPQLATPTSPFAPSPAVRTPTQRPRVSTLQEAILQGVADAVTSPALSSQPDSLPSNAAEFAAMFAPYEKQISQLMHALESS